MQGTSINPENLQEHLASAPNAAAKGQSQFFTPVELAKTLGQLLPEHRKIICDLNCGNGQLLAGLANRRTTDLLGVDIENCKPAPHDRGQTFSRIIGDLTLVFPLMQEADWQTDIFALNPPWDIHWHTARLKGLAESDLLTVRYAFLAVAQKATIDSTIATWMIALDRMTAKGEGLLIANEATLQRLVFGMDAPCQQLRDHVWAHFVLKGNPMTGSDGHQWGDDFQTGIVYFARSHVARDRRGEIHCRNLEELNISLQRCSRLDRQGRSLASELDVHEDAGAAWHGLRQEWTVRQKLARGEAIGDYNIWLNLAGEIQTNLSLFQKRALKPADKQEADRLFALNGQRPMQLVMQSDQRAELLRAVKGGRWRVHPELPALVEQAIAEYHAVRSPLYPLPQVQRLGYLDEVDKIVCQTSMFASTMGGAKLPPEAEAALRRFLRQPCERTWEAACHFVCVPGRTLWQMALELDREFESAHEDTGLGVGPDRKPIKSKPCNADETWRVLPDPKKLEVLLHAKPLFTAGQSYPLRTQTIEVERRTSKPGMDGFDEEFLLKGKELVIFITDDDGREHGFIDRRHLDKEVKVGDGKAEFKFVLQDLVEHFHIPEVPDVAALNPARFEELQQELRAIERQIGRGLKNFQMADLARGAMHSGLIFAWDTGLGKTWATFIWPLLRVGREPGTMQPKEPVLIVAPENLHQQIRDEASDSFGITKIVSLDSQETYHKLWPLKPGWYITSFTQLTTNKVVKMPDPNHDNQTLDQVAKLMQFYAVTFDQAKGSSLELPLTQRAVELCRERWRQWSENIGDVKGGIRCVYSPSLADLCSTAFAGVVVDEAVKMKGEETLVGIGCRQMNPPNRLVLTATPIKNRLPDLFWLAWWAAGGKPEAHARWPYSSDEGEQMNFAAEFLVTERNLTKFGPESKSKKKKRPRGKVTAEVCNIHRLWKLIAPIILRRRKADIGEDIVAKVRKPIYAPMGRQQAKVVAYHLNAPYRDSKGNPAILAKMQALRSAAAAPHSVLLERVADDPEADERLRLRNALEYHDPDGLFRSDTDYIPKVAAALKVIEGCMRRQEQFVLFSAFSEPLFTIQRRLDEARVPVDLLNGDMAPSARGKIAAEFKKGREKRAKPGLLAGLKAMAEGNSWHRANNVILLAFDWAYDLFEQGINRCHRLNSVADVNVWPVICRGTIDRKLESLIHEKRDACELVLDGQLLGESVAEVNLKELLELAHKEFSDTDTLDEALLEAEWPAQRLALREAYDIYCGFQRVEMESEPVRFDATMFSQAELVPAGLSTEPIVQVIGAPQALLLEW
jgi:SNF2 family DNA or RNA helicase